MLLLDGDGQILAINHFGAKRFNQIPSALLGQNFFAMVPPAVARTRGEACRQVMMTGEPLMIRDERNGIYFENNIYPVVNDEGQTVAVAVYAKDVTRERQIRATEEVFRHLDTVLLKWQMHADAVAQIFCDHLLPIYDLSAAWVGRAEKDGHITVLGQAEQTGQQFLQSLEPLLNWSSADSPWPYVAQTIRGDLAKFSRLTSEDISRHGEAARAAGVTAALVFPLTIQGRTWGALSLYSGSAGTLEANQSRLASLASRLAVSLEASVQQEWLALLNAALVKVDNAVIITDAGPRILWANEAASLLTGYPVKELLDQPTTLLAAERHPERARMIRDVTLTGKAWSGEHVFRHKDGHRYTVQLSLTPLLDPAGTLTHYVAVMEDISLRKQEEARVTHLAYYDALTGLPNRSLVMDRLNQAVHLTSRTGHPGAVLFIDLDHFKETNDQFGHDAGDEVLRQVSARLRAKLREVDTVGRLGGDEFVVVLNELTSIEDARQVAESLLSCFAEPVLYEGQPLPTGGSIGYALFPDQGQTAEDILRAADDAMYAAKQAGRNQARGPTQQFLAF